MVNQKAMFEPSDLFYNLSFYIGTLVWISPLLAKDYKDILSIKVNRMWENCSWKTDLPNWVKMQLVESVLKNLCNWSLLPKMHCKRIRVYGKNRKSIKEKLLIQNPIWPSFQRYTQGIVSPFSIKIRINFQGFIFPTLELPWIINRLHTNPNKLWEDASLVIELEWRLNFQERSTLKNSKGTLVS